MRRIRLAVSIVAAGVSALAVAGPAQASYHQNLIKEIHETGLNGDYVVLQAFAPGENLFGGVRQVVTYDGGGNAFSRVVIPTVPNGANQATVLAGDSTVTAGDATDASFNIINTGGTVCFSEGTTILSPPTGIDCLAYTSGATMFPAVPPASPYGTPFPLGGANFDGKSIVRSIARACPTTLDAADDTNDSAADFAFGTTNPRSNAAPITEVACAPCKNKAPTLVGTAGKDILTGTKGADIISGLAGKDKLKGLGGKDTICGGAGKDTILGGAGKDTLLGQGGNDVIKGGGANDRIKGGAGKDKVTP